MRRKSRTVLIAILVLAVTGLAVPAGPASGPGEPQQAARKPVLQASAPETTLRNVTDKTITYRIYPVHHPESLRTKTIAPNAIDRYRTEEALTVEFHTGKKDVVYSLDPGAPYSFRYDQETAIDLFLGSHGRADAVDLAPYVPTPGPVVDKMLEMAKVTSRDILYDIGCGDGRIVIAAARNYGARGVGIDLDKAMVERSAANAKAAGVTERVQFICMDATKADISAATVVTLYLLPESNALLRPLLEKQLRPGTRVVSHNYQIPGWEAKEAGDITLRDEKGAEHTIYLYVR